MPLLTQGVDQACFIWFHTSSFVFFSLLVIPLCNTNYFSLRQNRRITPLYSLPSHLTHPFQMPSGESEEETFHVVL